MAIALFPLSEGETIGSNIGRYADFVGLKSTLLLRRRLFGYACVPGTRLPSGISHLVEQTRDYWGMKGETVVRDHTEYRYTTMMVSPVMRETLLSDMLNPPSIKGLPANICRPVGERVTRFRYCEECLAEWREGKITPYWKISHQFPGVYTCVLHSSVLRAVKQPVESRLDATVVSLRDRSDELILQRVSLSEKNAAEDIAKRSARQEAMGDKVATLQKYRDLLRSAGFLRPDATLKREALISEWLAYFGPEYCYLTGISASKITTWLVNISNFTNAGEFLNPFMFIAAESFLENRSALPRSFVPATRNGSKVRENVTTSGELGLTAVTLESLACDGVLHRAGDDWKFTTRFGSSGSWKLLCSCGITYRVLDESQHGSPQLVPVIYGARYRRRFRSLIAKGASAKNAGRELHIGVETAKRWRRKEGYKNAATLSRAEIWRLRSEWRRLVESAPSVRRITSAHRANPHLFNALYRDDHAWLLTFNMKHRSFREGRKITCDQIREAWLALMKAEPPIRATQAAILEKAGVVSKPNKRNESRSMLLAELSETRQTYLERVISWLAVQATRQNFRNSGEAVRFARLQLHRFTKEQRVRIREFLSLNADDGGFR